MRVPFSINLRLAYLLVFLGILILTAIPPKAAAESPWLAGEPEVIDNGRVLNSQEFNDLRASKNGFNPGADCIKKRISKRKLGPWSIQYEDSCWYSTEIGLLSKWGNYLLQPGTDVAANIYPSTGRYPIYLPTPNPEIFLQLTYDGISSYEFAFRTADNMQFNRTEGNFGTATIEVLGTPSYEPIDPSKPSYARNFRANINELWWSNDGKYMLVAEDTVLWRFNLETFKLIGVNMAQYPGFHVTSSAAISSSGKYGALAVETKEPSTDLVIVDFDSCAPGETTNLGISNTCDTKSFKNILKRHADFTRIRLPRFYSDNTLGVYVYNDILPDDGHKLYLLQASGTEYSANNYVALGDSFSSGEGAGDYEPGTDVLDINMCHTSRNSYPYLINLRVDLANFSSVACSGAKMEDVLDDGQWDDILPEENLGSGRHPGYIKQFDILPLLSPNIVTITMSGNDIGFSNKLKYCLLSSSECYSSYEERLQIANEIRSLHPDLVDMYRQILRETGHTNPRLYVLGYPQIISNLNEVECGLNVQLNTYQRSMANDLTTYFNAVIKNAADHAGAYYVGTESALNGHRLCEDVSATMAVNGLTLGDDTLGVWKLRTLSNGTFHPNQLGHQLLANTVLERTSQFAETMPSPDTSVPVPNAENYPFLDMPSGGGLVRKLFYNPSAQPNLIQRGTSTLIDISNPVIPLRPFTSYDALLHSDSIYLGQVQSNGAGYIDAQVEIPNDVAPGLHELHIQGIGEDGSPIDVYEFVYVAASETDFDGDGVLNEDEPCGIVQPSGEDADQDGIDDACDSVIEVAPDTTPPTVEGTLSREPDYNGWYNQDVSINWNVTDPEPSSGEPTQPEPTVVDQDGVHNYMSSESCDPADNCATGSLEVKLDKTEPVINYSLDPSPNDAGWNNTEVTVTFHCEDTVSGVASCADPITLSGDGAYVVIGDAADNAGNSTSISVIVPIDGTAPTLGAPVWSNDLKRIDDTSTVVVPVDDNLSQISKAEYFLGETDPGEGNGASMEFVDGNATTTFGTDFPTGVYIVSVRAADAAGNWSSPVSDYLVVYNPDGARMTAQKYVIPSFANGDNLPGLISDSIGERAKFGFNVRYDMDGNIHQTSDFQLSYKTGTNCKKPTALNCHSFNLDADSIQWMTTQGENNSTGTFQGTGKLEVDSAITEVTFLVTGVDSEQQSEFGSDHFTLRVFAVTDNPADSTPLYHVSAEVLRGNINVRAP